MEHVVRVARLGHDRLRQTCFLKWVADRMTVSFQAVVHAHRNTPEIRGMFCTDSITKILHGRVVIAANLLIHKSYSDACIKLVNVISGRLLLYIEQERPMSWMKLNAYIDRFVDSLHASENLLYIIDNWRRFPWNTW